MLEDFPKEKLQEIYEILPQDLKEALFSQEVANKISDIGIQNNLTTDQITKITEYVGYILLGLLSPNEFEKTIKEKLPIEDNLARRINHQITRLVFLPVKNSLEIIYKIKMEVVAEPLEEKLPAMEESPKKEPPEEEKPVSKKPRIDIYREPVK